MCESCSSSDFLSCKTFGVWFYLIIAGFILLISVIIAGIMFKIRKNRKMSETLLSEPLIDDTK
jgi:hypothetical protein